MLSKVATLILGIIEEHPINPYEINKFLEAIRIRDWFPVAASSVYVTIKTLHTKGYITGETVKEGNMPEKTIYSITAEGKTIMNQMITRILGSQDLDPVEFNIGTLFMHYLDKETVLELLKNRIEKMQKDMQEIERQYDKFINNETVPAYSLISLKHNAYLYEAEFKTASELIEEIKNSPGWGNFQLMPAH
jgi:DNA-binding PadR family transcriptional regulator